MWRPDAPEGNESNKIKWELVPYTQGRGLDIGCGPYKPFQHFIGVDNGDHFRFGWKFKPDVWSDADDLSMFASQSLDFVFSSHTLEHLEKTEKTLREWWRVIKQDGYLILYLPHKNLYPNIGQSGSNPDHKHDFMPDDIVRIMRKISPCDVVRNEDRSHDDEYSFFQVFKKTKKPMESYKKPRPKKSCAVVRYGAFGDLIQASSLFPGLKKQGYHVTLYTTPSGWDIVKHDPHIDEVIIQGKEQVPNAELGDFWGYEKQKYDRFINLSESVEGTLLAMPGRTAHQWPHEVRHKYLNVNYLEFMHDLAGVPLGHDQKFYPTPEEREWARKERVPMGSRVILWTLAGSSVHKTWPHLDAALARILISYPDVHIVLVGDLLCQMLEAGWENEPRVHRRSGIWSIRQTLAFLEQSDLVIGPETGVLNASGFMPAPKIITLSHSSTENLTKHWIKTTALTAKTSCYPCHQMHYGFEFCRKDVETGCAQCQADISVDTMFEAINQWLAPAPSPSA